MNDDYFLGNTELYKNVQHCCEAWHPIIYDGTDQGHLTDHPTPTPGKHHPEESVWPPPRQHHQAEFVWAPTGWQPTEESVWPITCLSQRMTPPRGIRLTLPEDDTTQRNLSDRLQDIIAQRNLSGPPWDSTHQRNLFNTLPPPQDGINRWNLSDPHRSQHHPVESGWWPHSGMAPTGRICLTFTVYSTNQRNLSDPPRG